MDYNKTSMHNLKKIVKAQNKSLTSLAIELEISTEAISQYISGKIKPKLSTIIKMAKILNTSTDYLLDLTDNPIPNNFKITTDEYILLKNYKNISDIDKIKVNTYIETIIDLNNIKQ